jgi:hypothetical protein
MIATVISLDFARTDMRPDPRKKRTEPITFVVLLALALKDTALAVEASDMLARKGITHLYQLAKLSLEEFGQMAEDPGTFREIGSFLGRRCWINRPLELERPLLDFLMQYAHREYEPSERDAYISLAASHYRHQESP